jgi:hypothetical protein
MTTRKRKLTKKEKDVIDDESVAMAIASYAWLLGLLASSQRGRGRNGRKRTRTLRISRQKQAKSQKHQQRP